MDRSIAEQGSTFRTSVSRRFKRLAARVSATGSLGVIAGFVLMNVALAAWVLPRWPGALGQGGDYWQGLLVEMSMMIVDVVLVLIILPIVLKQQDRKRMAHIRAFILERLRRDVISISKNNWMYFSQLLQECVDAGPNPKSDTGKLLRVCERCNVRANEFNQQGNDLRQYLVLCMNALEPAELQLVTNYLGRREKYFSRYSKFIDTLIAALEAEPSKQRSARLKSLANKIDPEKVSATASLVNFLNLTDELKAGVLNLVTHIESESDDLGNQWQGIDLDEQEIGEKELAAMAAGLRCLSEASLASQAA